MSAYEIAFATIGKDGKDDGGHMTLASGSETPTQEASEIAFATIGKDGKDDGGYMTLQSGPEVPTEEASEIEL